MTVTGESKRRAEPEALAVDAPPPAAINADGVDLTQIRALAALSYTERARLLQRTVARLGRLRRHARRV